MPIITGGASIANRSLVRDPIFVPRRPRQQPEPPASPPRTQNRAYTHGIGRLAFRSSPRNTTASRQPANRKTRDSSPPTMSRASKLTLGATSLFAAATIVFVHFQQKAERAAMHEGVVRDMEQQRVKRERQLDFDMQRALEQEYKQHQTVRDSTSEADDTKAPAPR
ncbi:hypothetical protein PCL_05676 [Purpureocillium lilacinum]|uniref:Cytochrome c oxidase assembly protein n=2 Tax=Purpureocillium lilacinum TaxID=33203 RepID=A0A2U3DUM2_PURLI|nr:hypothetical protein PCL_05676 [Purpureocillium lilacinum]